MSLLIDALRKAEQAKRDAVQAPAKREEDVVAVRAAGTIEAPESSKKVSAARADTFVLDRSGDRPATAAWAPDPPATATAAAAANDAGATARRSARILFEAKSPPSSSGLLRLAAGLGAAATVGISAWVWWEIQPHGSLTAGPAMSARPVRSAGATEPAVTGALPAAAHAATDPPGAAPIGVASAAATPSLPRSAAAPPQAQGPAPHPVPASTPPVPARAAVAPSPPAAASPAASRPSAARGALAARAPSAPSAPTPTLPSAPGLGPIRHDAPPAGPPAALAAAYAAYGEGRLDEAERLYREVAGQFPLNRDAIDGLGAIALREGRRGEAEQWFGRALALDPKDPVALTGLANIAMPRAPADTESRLKQLLAATPDAAPAQFALGNALALQQRWSEAQQAYFRAYTLDADNPDYLFNLAVSLDHLGQGALAGRFYRQALAAAAHRAAAFDPNAARARLEALPSP